MWAHMCTAEIIKFEAEPNWYFEIWYVLQNQYNDGRFQEVRKGFKLDPEITYEIEPGHKRPLIGHLPLDELERYYKWRKTHYKGKIKNI